MRGVRKEGQLYCIGQTNHAVRCVLFFFRVEAIKRGKALGFSLLGKELVAYLVNDDTPPLLGSGWYQL